MSTQLSGAEPDDSPLRTPMLVQLLIELRRDPKLARTLREELQATDPDQLVDSAEMAEVWGVSVKTVHRWCREQRIPSAEKYGRGWRMPRAATVLPAARKTVAGPGDHQGRERRRLVDDPAGQSAIDRLRARTPASA